MANRDVTIKLTELGSDIDNVSIYKSSFTDANFIASVSRAVLMGDGYTFSVNDQISKFLLYSGEPCNATLELELPAPPLGTTTTTTTVAPTTTTTTVAPTTTTTTAGPTSRTFVLSISNQTGAGAAVSGSTSRTFTGTPGTPFTNQNVISMVSSGYTTPNTISVTDNSGSIATNLTGNSNSTSRTLTSTVTMPSSNSSGVVTITGNFTQVVTTTTAAPTTTTTTAAPTTTTTTAAPPNSLVIYNDTGSCANDACINHGSGSTTTLYYTGNLPATMYTDQALTTQAGSSLNGFHKIQSGASGALSLSNGTGTQTSCISSLTLFSNTSFDTTSSAACSYQSDNYYGDGGLLTTSSKIYSGNDGCSTVGVGYVSDGTDWVQTSAGGNVIGSGSC